VRESCVCPSFTGVQGVLTLDETDSTDARVEASVEASSVNTRDPQRDAHLKSADFFELERASRRLAE
jgi:polyisoprenoid-binding protein YceI